MKWETKNKILIKKDKRKTIDVRIKLLKKDN